MCFTPFSTSYGLLIQIKSLFQGGKVKDRVKDLIIKLNEYDAWDPCKKCIKNTMEDDIEVNKYKDKEILAAVEDLAEAMSDEINEIVNSKKNISYFRLF